MTSYSADELTAAVVAICPDIAAQLAAQPVSPPTEADLWRELCCCILSSQVPYGTAVAYASSIVADVLFAADFKPATHLQLHSRLRRTLKKPLDLGDRIGRYRFPDTKALQIGEAWRLVTKSFGSLQELLGTFDCAVSARLWLAENVSGLGPKQASMFLRNIGFSYDLAILDRHVLAYMAATEIWQDDSSVATLRNYSRAEQRLSGHAVKLGQSLGHLDWAIWIVMRVARPSRGVSLA